MNDLLVPEELNAATIFQPKEMSVLLGKIQSQVEQFKGDISTAKGRKDIKAFAYKISRSKTFLDELGKDLGEDWRAQINAVNSERKKMCDKLDDWRDEVRAPLTAFEEAEENRIATHENKIKELILLGETARDLWDTMSLAEMRLWLGSAEKTPMGEDHWDEYAPQALDARDNTISVLKAAIEKRKTHDSEQAELRRLREEAADRETKDREDAIAKEAEEKAAADADATIKEQRDRADKAERDKEAADEQHEKDQEAAVQRERDRIAGEEQAKADAAGKRKADAEHRGNINQVAINSLVTHGLSGDDAMLAINTIALGVVPNVVMKY